MKNQIFVLMACAAFLNPTSGFCMEVPEDENPVHRVFKNSELSVKILSYLNLPEGYNVYLIPNELSQLKFGELGVFCEDDGQLYCKVAHKEKMQIMRSRHSIFSGKADLNIEIKQASFDEIANRMFFQKVLNQYYEIALSDDEIRQEAFDEIPNTLPNLKGLNQYYKTALLNNDEIHQDVFDRIVEAMAVHKDLKPHYQSELLYYALKRGYTFPDLKNTELVSQDFCDYSRFFITSIKTPSWATDETLVEYTTTLPNLRGLKIITDAFDSFDHGGHTTLTPLTIDITDKGLEHLTHLTTLNIVHPSKITDNGLEKLTNLTSLTLTRGGNLSEWGIKNLINLTYLNVEKFWVMTDDGLIDEAGEPRHPQLVQLLLINSDDHKISPDVIELLENSGVSVKENEYSFVCEG